MKITSDRKGNADMKRFVPLITVVLLLCSATAFNLSSCSNNTASESAADSTSQETIFETHSYLQTRLWYQRTPYSNPIVSVSSTDGINFDIELLYTQTATDNEPELDVRFTEQRIHAPIIGDTVYFECEKVSGRLELGLDHIRLVVTESSSDYYPIGVYYFEKYEILR